VGAELMVLGFISLLLVFGQNYIIKICITEEAADTMLPCRLKKSTIEAETNADHPGVAGANAGVADHGGAHAEPVHFSLGVHPFTGAASFSVPHRMLSGGEANMKTKCPPVLIINTITIPITTSEQNLCIRLYIEITAEQIGPEILC
jgi:mlo protein